MPKFSREMRISLAVAGALTAGATIAAFAHTGAKGVVKQRMDAMGDIAEQMKLLGGMVQEKTAFDAGVAAKAASIVAGHAEEIPALFPEGSTDHPSEALPIIWTDWPRFEASAWKLAMDAAALGNAAQAADNADDIKATLAEVASSCKSCHEVFRLKK